MTEALAHSSNSMIQLLLYEVITLLSAGDELWLIGNEKLQQITQIIGQCMIDINNVTPYTSCSFRVRSGIGIEIGIEIGIAVGLRLV